MSILWTSLWNKKFLNFIDLKNSLVAMKMSNRIIKIKNCMKVRFYLSKKY